MSAPCTVSLLTFVDDPGLLRLVTHSNILKMGILVHAKRCQQVLHMLKCGCMTVPAGELAVLAEVARKGGVVGVGATGALITGKKAGRLVTPGGTMGGTPGGTAGGSNNKVRRVASAAELPGASVVKSSSKGRQLAAAAAAAARKLRGAMPRGATAAAATPTLSAPGTAAAAVIAEQQQQQQRARNGRARGRSRSPLPLPAAKKARA